MGKSKKEIQTEGEAHSPKNHKKKLSDDYIDSVSPIASPLAHKKLRKKVFKALKKASKVKHIQRGVKEVVKALKRGEKGLVVLAGDISPIDVISHLPVLCEDHSCPYVFVPSKESLGEATNTQRPTSCIMIVPGGKNKDMTTAESTYMEIYEEILEQVENAHTWDQPTKNT
ncbi:hypothetical protein T552_02236 [Pneumocystis carinii B80]|uniref:H/ACA ribonucleoprotein complex subunit 2 n=1 Tax=Pneumocystis carinii (strain B80) TaxID=1408658 RepID=A0A0W4ZHF9_PNEC8|nr:hypothetical protein T552_02236 [Pneumocystis carinii B80]KTW27797.1 hypothetical protein T552_02236 [Pneumocystis carinii B80]